jgi:hypothetical protein
MRSGSRAVLVREGGAHGLGVLGAELEDLAHLDAARALEGTPALGAEVALLGLGHDVDPAVGDLEVAPGLGVHEVVARLVGADEPPRDSLSDSSAQTRTPSGSPTGPMKPLTRPYCSSSSSVIMW